MRPASLFVIAAVVLASATAQAQGRGGAAGQAPPAAAQAPLVRTASLAGQVVDADTGAPVGGAIVRLQSRLLGAATGGGRGAGAPGFPGLTPNVPPGTDAVIADGEGRFVFHNLPKGATQLSATAAGYLDRPTSGLPPRPIQLEDDKHLDGVRLRLSKVASVSGIVVDEAGEPAVGLSVRVLRRETPQGIPRLTASGFARTDDRGLYRIDNLPPGQLYVFAPLSQTTVPAAEAERPALLSAMNPIIEAMTGGTQTSLMPPGVRVGDRILRVEGGGILGAGLTPAPPVNGRIAAYQTTFYPGVTQLTHAMAITVRSGEDRTGLDFQIRPTASAVVSGVLTGASGPAASTMMRLLPAPGRAEDEALTVASTTTATDGSFVFLGVPTGQYIVKAAASARGGAAMNVPAEALANVPSEIVAAMQSRMNTGGDSYYLQAPISVGERDVTGLALAMRVGAKFTGRVVFEGAAPKPALQQLQSAQVNFNPVGAGGGGGPQTRLTAEATFTTGTYAPGTYTASVTGVPAPWLLRSVTVGGRDLMSTGIELSDVDLADVELTFTDRPSSVTGFARQDGTGPTPNATVILVSADFRTALNAGVSPRQQTAVVQPTGAFTLGRLVPGEYYVIAVLDEGVPADRDQSFFEGVLRSGTRVTLAEGEARTIDLKIARSIR